MGGSSGHLQRPLHRCAASMGSGCAKLAKLQSFWCIRHCAQLKGSVTENERASLTQLAEIQTFKGIENGRCIAFADGGPLKWHSQARCRLGEA